MALPGQIGLITAAGVTTTQTGVDMETGGGLIGGHFVLNMTNVGTGSVTLTIQGKDVNGTYYTILAGAAVTTNSTNAYFVVPGATTTTNVAVGYGLPRVWRVLVTANNVNATTYTVTVNLLK